jgi:hypothetical protein
MKITIEHKEASSEDIFKPGSLVIDQHDFLLLVTDGNVYEGENYFAGVIINRPKLGSYNQTGEHCTAWKRSEFTKFVGTITLEQ